MEARRSTNKLKRRGRSELVEPRPRRGEGGARFESSPAVENEFEAVQESGAYAPLTPAGEPHKGTGLAAQRSS